MELGPAVLDPLLSLQFAKRPPQPTRDADPTAIRRAAEEFEAFFVARMLEPMFDGISTEPPFGGGTGEKIWRSLLIEKYGEVVARTGGFGIADAVERQLLLAQEGL